MKVTIEFSDGYCSTLNAEGLTSDGSFEFDSIEQAARRRKTKLESFNQRVELFMVGNMAFCLATGGMLERFISIAKLYERIE